MSVWSMLGGSDMLDASTPCDWYGQRSLDFPGRSLGNPGLVRVAVVIHVSRRVSQRDDAASIFADQ
jgi:hypothetical protein